jgi:hypothetical protein
MGVALFDLRGYDISKCLAATSLVSSSWTTAGEVKIRGERGNKVGKECAWATLQSLESYCSLY